MENFLGILLTVEFIWIIFSVIMILLTRRPSTDRFSWKNITRYSLIAFWLTFIAKMFSLDVKTGAYWSVFTLAAAGLIAFYRYVNKTGIWSRTSGKFLAGIMLAIWTLVTFFMISAGVSAGWFILNGFIILIFLIIWLPSSWLEMNFTHISAEQLLTKIFEYDFRSSAGEFGKYYVLRDPSDQVAVSALADLVRPINAG